LKWLGARIVEYKHRSAAIAYEFQRADHPRSVEVVLQTVLVCETIETDG
jgi:hypothetical protein